MKSELVLRNFAMITLFRKIPTLRLKVWHAKHDEMQENAGIGQNEQNKANALNSRFHPSPLSIR